MYNLQQNIIKGHPIDNYNLNVFKIIKILIVFKFNLPRYVFHYFSVLKLKGFFLLVYYAIESFIKVNSMYFIFLPFINILFI